jgi:hypothetical protein
MKLGRNTAAVIPERARGSDWGMKSGSRCGVDRLLSVRSGGLRRYAWQRASRADRGPCAYHTDAGKALSFSAAGPFNGRWWRLPGMQTRDLRLLKTFKSVTVASTPLAIW